VNNGKESIDVRPVPTDGKSEAKHIKALQTRWRLNGQTFKPPRSGFFRPYGHVAFPVLHRGGFWKDMKPLSPRQLQVMRGLCAGLVAKEIAHGMNRGVRTVESHIQQAKRNLGARNIAHATFICGREKIFG